MVRAVAGFMSEDGIFFETEAEAERHDAALEITRRCEGYKNLDPKRLIKLIEALRLPLRMYIDAYEKVLFENNVTEDTGSTGRDQTNDELGNALDETVEQQSVGGHNDVSDMGYSSRTESVPKRSKKYGA